MKDSSRCEACGATLPEDSTVCASCGYAVGASTTSHGRPDADVAASAESATGRAAPVPGGATTERPKRFSPAPRIPAPLPAARPSKRFVPMAGMVIEPKGEKKGRFGRRRKKGAVVKEDEGVEGVEIFDDDQTPAWVYKTILVVSLLGVAWGFLFWNSDSELIGPGWKTGLLIEMVILSIIALVMWVRLARKLSYGSRFVAFLARRRDATMRSLRNAAYGVASAGKNIKSGGTHFREGLVAKKESGVVGKFVRKIVSFFARIVLGIIRLIVGIFKLIYRIYVWVDQLLWAVYRGIVEPVVRLAVRIVRWALKVVWRVLRWALKVVWKVFYWLVRRWPIKYVTRLLEQPVGGYARHRVLLTNVVISDVLGAPVKPKVRQAAEPYMAVYQLHRDTRTAARLMEKEEAVDAERDLWLTIPTAEERRALAEEKKRRKAEEKAAAKQAEIDAKEAKKQAKKDRKEELKRAKAEGRDLKAEEKEAKKKDKAEKKDKGDEEGTPAGEAPAEGAPVPDAAAQAEEEKDKKKAKKEKKPKLSRAEKKRQKQQAKLEKQAEKVREKRRKKEEKKQAKLDKKAAKKAGKGEKKAKKGKKDQDADEAPAAEPEGEEQA